MAAPASAVEATATRLLDFSQEYDVDLLDSTVAAFFGSRSNEEVGQADTHRRHWPHSPAGIAAIPCISPLRALVLADCAASRPFETRGSTSGGGERVV